MDIKDMLDGVPGPTVPKSISTHIIQRTCCHLTIVEIVAFQSALQSLAAYIEHQCPLSSEALVEIVYTDSQEVSLLRAGTELGQSAPLAVIWLNEIRNMHLEPLWLMLIFLEEVCHTLFQIQNEYKVKEIVFEVLRIHIGDKTLHNIYPTMFDKNNQRIPLPEYPAEWLTES